MLERGARALTHAAAGLLVLLVCLAASQPLFTDDVWWHLSLGQLYVEHGPWLDADPTLYTALRPPAPASWASGVALHAVATLGGLQALRVAHTLAVAGILLLGWRLLRRAGGSPAQASAGVAVFACLAAYRLFQLRPDLATIAGALLVAWLLLPPREQPFSWGRVLALAGVMGLWANAHGGFVAGLALLGAAAAGAVASALLSPESPTRGPARALRLAVAFAASGLASLANPMGARQLGLYFEAGGDTPALEVVADEWAAVGLFDWPLASVPPTPLSWALVWALLLATPLLLGLHALRARQGRVAEGPDPMWLALVAAALIGALSAVRTLFLLGIVLAGLLLSLRALTQERDGSRARTLAALALAVGLLPAFVVLGPWPMISRELRSDGFTRPYNATKYHAHAIWFLRDSGVTGHAWNDYFLGNFLAYWLAPDVRGFVNGSLNVPLDVWQASRAMVLRTGLEGVDFETLLDRHEVDLFVGVGLPTLPHPSRPAPPTVAHLEGTSGWLPIFRNLRSAVYLRNDAHNAPNLARVARYYTERGIPFEAERGFDIEAAIREAPDWAIANGVIPSGFFGLERSAQAIDPRQRLPALELQAAILATDGLYERSLAIDERRLRLEPEALGALRRRVWCLLRLGRTEPARRAAERLAAVAEARDPLSRLLVEAATRVPTLAPARARALIATLPVFTRAEPGRFMAGFQPPEARPAHARRARAPSERP